MFHIQLHLVTIYKVVIHSVISKQPLGRAMALMTYYVSNSHSSLLEQLT